MEQLLMSRDDKNADLLQLQLPDGYFIRSYNEGDGIGWCKCCIDGDLGVEEISESVFKKIMLDDSSVDPDNIFFLIAPSGDIAGTVTYQHTDDENKGCIHMVGIEKNYLGKGLAAPLNSYAVKRMIDDGKKYIVLKTDDWRIPAIKTYLRIGFSPVINEGDTDMSDRWEKVMEQININNR